jgi:hypothetical protein
MKLLRYYEGERKDQHSLICQAGVVILHNSPVLYSNPPVGSPAVLGSKIQDSKSREGILEYDADYF